MSAIQQLFDVLVVYLAALALSVWTMLTNGFDLAILHAKTFINADTKPIEGFKDIFFCSRHKACTVCVFDSKQHITPVLTGKKIVVQSGTNTANVKCTGRGWCKTNSYSSFHIIIVLFLQM